MHQSDLDGCSCSLCPGIRIVLQLILNRFLGISLGNLLVANDLLAKLVLLLSSFSLCCFIGVFLAISCWTAKSFSSSCDSPVVKFDFLRLFLCPFLSSFPFSCKSFCSFLRAFLRFFILFFILSHFMSEVVTQNFAKARFHILTSLKSYHCTSIFICFDHFHVF